MNKQWMCKTLGAFLSQKQGDEDMIVSNISLPIPTKVTNSYWIGYENPTTYNGWSRYEPVDVSKYDYVEIKGIGLSLKFSFTNRGSLVYNQSGGLETRAISKIIVDVKNSDYLCISFATISGSATINPVIKGEIKYQ